ncbi:MAG: TetR/AcrR family transcriptional regulator [Solirubrobacteraceae bacterium]
MSSPPMRPLATDTSPRPLRADAQRNRASVLAGARRAFREEGLDADMASIAQRSGVGVGTVYRHFPTKEALLEALALDHFERLAEIVEGIEAQERDAWAAVEQQIWQTATYTAEDFGMCEVLSMAPATIAEMPPSQRLRRASWRIVEKAQAAGVVRDDATPGDIPLMMCGFGRIAAAQRAGAPMDWRRYLEIMLDGLRAR